MEETQYFGTWYITFEGFKTMTGGKLDLAPIKAQIEQNPSIYDVVKEQLEEVISMFEWHFILDADGLTQAGSSPATRYDYSISDNENERIFTWKHKDGDDKSLSYRDGKMYFGGIIELSKVKSTLKTTPKPTPDIPLWVESFPKELIKQTFFGSHVSSLG